MTDAEQWVWGKLRRRQVLGIQFYRQRPIGAYIVHFYAPRVEQVIEINGAPHLEQSNVTRDRRREEYLRRQRLQVLRFDNLQVLKEGQAVLDTIWAHCERALKWSC